MIDITKNKDAVRVFNNAIKPNANPKGTWILYHIGSYVDGVNDTLIGRAAWEASERGVVALVQKKLADEPREYGYYAVVTGVW